MVCDFGAPRKYQASKKFNNFTINIFSKAPFYVTGVHAKHNDPKIIFVKNSAKLSHKKCHARALNQSLESTCLYPRVPKRI